MPSPQHFNEIGEDNLPGHLKIEFTQVELDEIREEQVISKVHLALANTAAG